MPCRINGYHISFKYPSTDSDMYKELQKTGIPLMFMVYAVHYRFQTHWKRSTFFVQSEFLPASQYATTYLFICAIGLNESMYWILERAIIEITVRSALKKPTLSDTTELSLELSQRSIPSTLFKDCCLFNYVICKSPMSL